jgi:hypothetical protein
MLTPIVIERTTQTQIWKFSDICAPLACRGYWLTNVLALPRFRKRCGFIFQRTFVAEPSFYRRLLVPPRYALSTSFAKLHGRSFISSVFLEE